MESKLLLHELSMVYFPVDLVEHFEIVDINNYQDYVEIRFNELSGLIPTQLTGETGIIKDGFLNPIELQTFPAKGKPVYLKVYRRRWKKRGKLETYWNNYELNPVGIKATKRFANFVKKLLQRFSSNFSLISTAVVVDRKKLWRWKKVMVEGTNNGVYK
mgnify:CR=1 FL=1